MGSTPVSGVEEITDEEATRIEQGETDEEREMRLMLERVAELRGVLWGNIAAVRLKLVGRSNDASVL